MVLAEFDPDTWGTAAEWASGVGTLPAFVVTLALLMHEVRARSAAEETTRRVQELTVARDLLRVLRPIYSEMQFSNDGIRIRSRCKEVTGAVEERAFEIRDEEMRTRLHVLRLVAFTVGWGEEKWEKEPSKPSWWGGVMRLRTVFVRVIWSLENYIKDERLPGWADELPPTGAAQSWAMSGRTTGLPRRPTQQAASVLEP